MALTITTLTLLNQYINGVMSRADHHGHNVNEIVLALAGAVIWKATEDIEVRSNNNSATGNVLWLTVNQHKYVLAFNHNTGDIELRDRSLQGNVVEVFNNRTTLSHVKTIFASL